MPKLLSILAAAGISLLAAGPSEESIELFNGKDLSGWIVEGPREYKDQDGQVQPMWKMQDGILTCAGKAFGFLRYEKQQFADFAMHVEYRMAPKGNSGIGIRTIAFDPKRSA